MLHEVTDETFEAEIAESGMPCVVAFTAGWCTMCDAMVPTLEELSERYDGKVRFCIVNVDRQKGLRIRFAVASLPYIVLVNDGMKTPLFDELVTAERLGERIDYVLAGNPAPTTMPL